MKRILAIICVLACLCGFALPAMAAPDTITVYVDAPSDWASVSLYVWVDDNGATTPLCDWPGTAMKKGDDGWYTLEIPAGHNRVIANNGNGIQTVDLIMDGNMDAWLTVTTAGSDGKFNGDIAYVNPGPAQGGNGGGSSEPSQPSALTNMALVGEGNDALKWEPDNAACAMTKSGDGIYTKELTMYKGETIKFKLCGNNSWDGGYNLGGNADGIVVTAGTAVSLIQGNESKDLSYTATQDCTLTVTLDMNGDAPSVTLTEAKAELAPPPEKVYVKLYVSVAGEFTPNVWAWGDNGDAFPSWPGQAMTKSGDWWVVEIPNDCHSAIINDGTSQTSDLTITMGAENWIVVDEAWAATVSASEPSLEGDKNDKPSTDATKPTTPSDDNKDDNTDTTGDTDKDSEGGVNPFVIVTIVLAVLAVGAVVATVIIIKKKKA